MAASTGETCPTCGVSLRLDHWDLLMDPAFTTWLASKGVEPFFIFPMQPEGNRIAERFFRTLKGEVPVLPYRNRQALAVVNT